MSIKKVIDMKRNGLLLAFLLSIAISARCDNVYLFEQFNDDFLPYGWNVSGIGNDYWWIANSNNAGGTPNGLFRSVKRRRTTTWAITARPRSTM